MRLGSVCSGIGGAELAFAGLAEPVFASEIERFPRAVLAHRFPGLRVLGDFREIGGDHAVDVLAGGTPCQSFSVAGLRGGLADDRGNLAREFVRLADRLRPRWLLWENVPGVLSSDGGWDFGSILGALVECGYGCAWRSLDAQFFHLAQRRERVFVVGCLGDWRRAAAVLFEPASLRGHPPPRREARAAAAVGALCGTSPGGAWRIGADEAAAGQLIAFGGNNTGGPIDVATACNAHGGPHGRLDFESETFIAHTLRGDGFDASEDGTGRGTPLVAVGFDGTNDGSDASDDLMPTLRAQATGGQNAPAVAFSCKDHGADAGDLAPTLRAMGHDASHANAGGQVAVAGNEGIRRLTPRECERLQGYPDDFTLIPWRGGLAADGPRYKAIGNAWPVPVVRWIARRLAAEHRAGLKTRHFRRGAVIDRPSPAPVC
jgi:DNA (cytosine-5)-methyltransferase 1